MTNLQKQVFERVNARRKMYVSELDVPVKEAQEVAIEDVAQMYGLTVAETQHLFVQYFNDNRNAIMVAWKHEAEEARTIEGEAKTIPDKRRKKRAPNATNARGIRDLYRAWIQENGIVPTDKAVAHFAKCSVSTPYDCRKALEKEGYAFELLGNNHGWLVTKRPKQTPEKNGDSSIDIMLEFLEFLKAKGK